MYNLGFSVYEFTWENRREDEEVVEEILDRFYISIEWSITFPNAEVLHLNENLSDHLPLFLKIKHAQVRHVKGNRHFMFENMWVQEESCRQVIKEM